MTHTRTSFATTSAAQVARQELANRFARSGINAPFLLAILCSFLTGTTGVAQSFSRLYSFAPRSGQEPYCQLVQDAQGALYGTAKTTDGASGGVVFRVSTNGSGYTVLKSFVGPDGEAPVAGLAIAGSVLYGTTSAGGAGGLGTIFKLNTDGSGFQTLANFQDTTPPGEPVGKLLLSGSTLYGVTQVTNSSDVLGTVYRINVDGSVFQVVATFYSLDDVNDGRPNGDLVLSGGLLYGTTYDGGTNSEYGGIDVNGTVFKVSTAGGDVITVKSLDGMDEGGNPVAGLVLSGTTLYGTATYGGANYCGTIFKLSTTGTSFSVLRALEITDGVPESSLVISGTTLYGTTPDGGTEDYVGTVFKISTSGTGYSVLKEFAGADGASPEAGLLINGSTLYGTTATGGGADAGTVYKLSTTGTGFSVVVNLGIDAGNCPNGSLLLTNGMLYGTAAGGLNGSGVVFSISTNGVGYSVLWDFNGTTGESPNGGLVLYGSKLFGTTVGGGQSSNGVAYSVGTNGTAFTVLKHFSTEANPMGGLVLAGTNLFGVTQGNGDNDLGAVFRLSVSGNSYSVLKRFDGTSGSSPSGPLKLAGLTLYGACASGGNADWGCLFKLNTNGTGFAVLKHFDWDIGGTPNGGLLLAGSTLFGTCWSGGTNGEGTVYAISTNGSGFSVLRHLTAPDANGWGPDGSLAQSGTTLLGTTGCGGADTNGTLYRINPDGTCFAILRDFAIEDGEYPNEGLIAGGGSFFGTCIYGGDQGLGTIYQLAPGPVTNPPTITSPPQDQTVVPGASAVFRVTAIGTGPISYQWRCGGATILGATASVLTLTNVQADSPARFSVVVCNPGGVACAGANLKLSPANITSYQIDRSHSFTVRAMVIPGGTYDIQASTNLAVWTTLYSITNAPGNLSFTDAQATNLSRRFYRLQAR